MLLDRQQFFVKERVAMLKLTDTYDILDVETQQRIGIAKEEPSAWSKYARLVVNKILLPTTVNIYEDENEPPVLTLWKKGLMRPGVFVSDNEGRVLGMFKSKFFSLGGGFQVYDPGGVHVAEVKGDWKGWNFRLLDVNGQELGLVTKKWAGLGKELFTSADNYIISLSDASGSNPTMAGLLLAAGLAIDIIFKERK